LYAGVFISFVGWLCFGVLSFLIPPALYLHLMPRVAGPSRLGALDAGEHWAAWAERLSGRSLARWRRGQDAAEVGFAALGRTDAAFDVEAGAVRMSPTLPVAATSTSATATAAGATAVITNGGGGTAVGGRLWSGATASASAATSPAGGLVARRGGGGSGVLHAGVLSPAFAPAGEGGVLGYVPPRLPWYRSVWVWEQVGLWTYIVAGCALTVAGMAMVVLEAVRDASHADHVSGRATAGV